MRERVAQLAGRAGEGDHGRHLPRLLRAACCASTARPSACRASSRSATPPTSSARSSRAMRELRVHETTMHPSARAGADVARQEPHGDARGRSWPTGSGRPRPARRLGLAALPGVPRPHALARLRRPAAGDGAPAARARRRARALPEALPLRAGRRVPGHEPPAVRDRASRSAASTATCAWWATTTSRSTAGAAPTSRRSWASTATSRARRSSACRRTTARRGRSWTPPTRSSARTPSRHEKALESARGDGEPVRFARLKDETAEAQFVVERDAQAPAARGGEAARTSRSSAARRSSSGRSRASCARTGCPTWWSAACRSSTARRCATSSPT